MAQVFPKGANTLARMSLFCAAAAPLLLFYIGSTITRSGFNTKVDVPLDQPIPFSHEHHANELGIDCRYCHTTVEKTAFAGIPPTHTCMSCHSQIWTNSPLLEPLRESYRTGVPLRWVRINKLPEFVYFNHAIHVNRGINCNNCHGPVQTMQLTYKGKPFFMKFCVDCHRNPEGYIRPKNEVFDLYYRSQTLKPSELSNDERELLTSPHYHPSHEREVEGEGLMKKYNIRKEQLTDCWVCHR